MAKKETNNKENTKKEKENKHGKRNPIQDLS